MKKLVSKFFSGLVSAIAVTGIFATAGSQVQAAGNKQDVLYSKIKTRGKLIVGTSADFPPYEFLAQKNGKQTPAGADMSLAKRLAKGLGVKLEIKNMSFDSLLVAQKSGRVDVLIAGMGSTPERKKQVDFSIPYYTAKETLVINKSEAKKIKSYKDLAGKRVGVQTSARQESLIKSSLAKNKLSAAHFVQMQSNNDLILALQTNKIDAVALSGGVGQAYAHSVSGLKYVYASYPKGVQNEEGMQVVIPKHQQTLVAHINKTIKKVNKQKVFPKWIAQAGKQLGKAK
ncbi:transporter substrate-binding domain-containing protein [Oenococcus kitaharae]|uniref:Amino acid ABC transporter, amino acid-binding/permease protein n=1 Tax=Oenococcus kitaharae DSM 17330 TaxID=1045004 RepID=G9WGR8_9LACO|nr:transporter substrate-binding domain-containing protein [Oenococcus kitaharae]EHN59895.1 Amino acid ABC transporter, amino acid-binding/permease protein [Oenococcus kitaharae DSM 17330]OEY82086.1 amino acid ABC transporter substrate-binding protein [Oenococcus kitaharae]OEY82459.1 amino acid ABC transporter substrate-binding protein [Oenococcus kitaharae]OEY83799.1 amino acid ABC transporter substrate-binding protein [Oenococcus kitaharae]